MTIECPQRCEEERYKPSVQTPAETPARSKGQQQQERPLHSHIHSPNVIVASGATCLICARLKRQSAHWTMAGEICAPEEKKRGRWHDTTAAEAHKTNTHAHTRKNLNSMHFHENEQSVSCRNTISSEREIERERNKERQRERERSSKCTKIWHWNAQRRAD